MSETPQYIGVNRDEVGDEESFNLLVKSEGDMLDALQATGIDVVDIPGDVSDNVYSGLEKWVEKENERLEKAYKIGFFDGGENKLDEKQQASLTKQLETLGAEMNNAVQKMIAEARKMNSQAFMEMSGKLGKIIDGKPNVSPTNGGTLAGMFNGSLYRRDMGDKIAGNY